MTEQEKQKVLDMVEKSPHKSKKFIAWLIQQMILSAMAIVALIKQPVLGWPLSAFMTGIVFVQGISTMYYLGRQAALDSTIRGFALVGNAANPLANKDKKTEADKS